MGRLLSTTGALVGHVARGEWVRYGVFAGTNDARTIRRTAAALVRRTPLLDGPAIAEYERAFARAAGTRFATSFAAGRMALFGLLRALGIGDGDEVLLPAFTCVVVPNAIQYSGAIPVYVDIDPTTYNIDPAQIESKITPRTRAIIAQHTFGLVCDVEAIGTIAVRHALPVLEDAAHALGATHRGRPAGSLGTAAYFSTDHTKIISTGTGGMVTTDDPQLAERLRAIQADSAFLPAHRVRRTLLALASETMCLHPRAALAGRYAHALLSRVAMRGAFFADELETRRPTAYPFPARLANAQAAVGLDQLADLDANLAARRALARRYEEEIGAFAHLGRTRFDEAAWLRYTFLVDDRDAWQAHLSGVLDMEPWFTSVTHGRANDLQLVSYRTGSCPRAERVARHCVNLPTHGRVANPDRLLDAVRGAHRSGRAALRILNDRTQPESSSAPFAEYWNDESHERDKPYGVRGVDDPRLLDYLQTVTNLRRCFEAALAFADTRYKAVREHVLDLGAGVGWSTAIVSRWPGVERVWAVDYSEHRLMKIAPIVFEQLGAASSRIARHCGSMSDLPVDLPPFDLVIFCQALYMCSDPTALLRYVRQRMAGGGLVVVACERVEPSAPLARWRRRAGSLRVNPPRQWIAALRGVLPDSSGRYPYGDQDYERFITGAGLEFERNVLDYPLFPGTDVPAINYFGVKPF